MADIIEEMKKRELARQVDWYLRDLLNWISHGYQFSDKQRAQAQRLLEYINADSNIQVEETGVPRRVQGS